MAVVLSFMFTQNLYADDCGIGKSLAQKSEFRTDGGFTPIDNSVTEVSVRLGCGNFDTFVWGIHDNSRGKINEVDYGIGYSFELFNLNGRIGIERWNYKETSGKNDVIISDISYNELPFILSLKVTDVIDDDGTQITTSISKDIEIGKRFGLSLKLIPQAKLIYLDNFFGVTGHSNDVYGITLNGTKDKFSINLVVNHHDGHKEFSDSTQFVVATGYSF